MPLSVLRAYFHRHTRGSSPQFVIDRNSVFKRMAWVSWSPDGAAIAVGTPEGIQLRDAHDGTLLRQWKGGPALAWSPDGTALVAQWLPDAEHVTQWTFQIWERATGESRCTYRAFCGSFVYALAWSPDGTRIAHSTSGDREGRISLWNTETGSPLLAYQGHSGSRDVHTLSWSPDSAFLVSRDSNGSIQVWRSTDGTVVHQLTEQGALSGNAVWSPEGSAIATDGIALTIWDALTGEVMSRHRSGGHLSQEAWS
ncbi:MAG: WD40 repeat domain-containing protein, partial [Chloroflexi bacterium]|nr:WD40 repeat domain-containing protein [Chloroflexota bacterium]